MRNMRLIASAVSFAWVVTFAQAQVKDIDLSGAVPVSNGQCEHDGKYYKCFILQKVDKYYMVAIDSQGTLAIYSVPGLKDDYEEEECVLLWSRTPKRRKDDGTST